MITLTIIGLFGILIGFDEHSFIGDWSDLMTGASHEAMHSVKPAASIANLPLTQSFWPLLGIGLMTGLSHCVGMCGPLISAFAMQRRREPRSKPNQGYFDALILFQTGRLLSYTIIGAIAGSIGFLLSVGHLLRQLQGLFSFGLGFVLILMAFGLLGWLPTQQWFQSVAWTRWTGRQMQHLLHSDHFLALLGLGLINGLLPCGAIYAMSVLAISTASPLQGALLMLVFGLGTFPAMLGVGLSINSLSLPIRRNLFQLSALLVLLLGGQLLMRGLALINFVPHVALGGVMIW